MEKEFREFILTLDAEIKEGVRAEVALRRVVASAAESIRQKEISSVATPEQIPNGVP
jgi:hypothetical protein